MAIKLDDEQGLSLDFTGVSSGIEDRENGWYEAVIDNFERKPSKAGKDTLVVRLRYPDTNGIVYLNIGLEKALFKLKELLTAAGAKADDMTGEFKFVPARWLNKHVMIQITHQPYNNPETGEVEERMNVGHIRPVMQVTDDAPSKPKAAAPKF